MIWENGIETCIISYMKRVTSPRSMHDTGCLGLVHWDADYEVELRHAIAADIDYFAYCWYDRKPHTDHLVTGQTASVDDKVCELVDARLKHIASPLRNQIGLCAILITPHPYSDEELDDLVKTMQEPFYEKVNGRPLVYLFLSPNWKEALGRLRDRCAKVAETVTCPGVKQRGRSPSVRVREKTQRV